ncbi:AbrB/MazE/SpoVT family DNA-binding domain-containing protein [Cytobacillus purgationiresistens]|uniref:Transcriptional pleiotropic regulator of transition state genes n=1 Tax=Cytobacillus purgationiresistens TaxID=863449 RepID=A0ABU0AJV9_9BACI|nr:AbrB/MazE/SpoVT family DNA-binding domain-containing protein [Cytobacillus purgationiresistens]MDQ0271042.1 transcriptional pleiotropic regulator of transition state genes [Cytobacillus purgationiresistens]
MKSTGIVRKVDELGRIVIPKELRRTQEIAEGDPLEIFVEENKIILKKYESYKSCMITGEILPDNLTLADGKIILSKEAAKQLIEDIEAASKI